jgi:hypothetical protein
MGKNTQSMLISNTTRESAKVFQKEHLKIRREQEDSFLNQSIDYRDLVFAPKGYEGVVLGTYVLMVPYLMGLVFLFLFVARASYEYFLQFNLTSFFIIWAIGYEVCAGLILIGIFFAWFKHVNNRWNKEQMRQKTSKKF